MTKRDKATLLEGLNRLCADIAVIASLFEASEEETRNKSSPAGEPACEPTPEPKPETAQKPAREPAPEASCTYEEIRAMLAEKTRSGYRAEIKALLTRHGVRQLSEISDPREYARLRAEAEAIGNG